MSKKIKIKGKCPRCGSKLEMGLLCYEFSYMDEPEVTELLPICTNNNCDESCGCGSEIKYRWINHRTVKLMDYGTN